MVSNKKRRPLFLIALFVMCGMLMGADGRAGVNQTVGDVEVNRFVQLGDVTEFEGSHYVSDPNNTQVRFLWDFGDGQKAEGSKVKHVYEVQGMYPVTLTLDDGMRRRNLSIGTVMVIDLEH